MTEDEIQLVIKDSGLGTFGQSLYARRLPCVDFRSTPASESDSLAVSRLGGPFLAPVGFTPPTYEGVPMDFVCQIAASDVHHLAPHLGGHLLFFAPVQAVMDGHDAAAVIHVTEGTRVAPCSTKAGDYLLQQPAILHAKAACSLPSPQDPFQSPDTQPWHEVKTNIREKLIHLHCLTTRIDDDPYHNNWHRFMGHPDPIQYDVRPFIHRSGAPTEWLALLAVYEDRNAGIYFGDTGALYFYISKAKFELGDFSEVLAFIQTC